MSTSLTSKPAAPTDTAVLSRLAERWRSVGVYLAAFAPTGEFLWHDPQMPQLLALCALADASLSSAIRRLPLVAGPQIPPPVTPVPGVEAHLAPLTRGRRLTGWLAILARTDAVVPSEELYRLATRAAVDTQLILRQAARIMPVCAAALPALASIVGHMHADFAAATTTQKEIADLTEQLTATYEEINLLHRISTGMRFSQKPQAFLEKVCRQTQETGAFRAVAVALAHREDEFSDPTFGNLAVLVGDCSLQGPELVNALNAPIQEALAAAEPRVLNDLAAASDYAHLRSAFQRAVCVPLTRDKRPLGIMLALDKLDGSPFNSIDLQLLNNVASQCAIFVENATLYQDMQDLFMGLLHALTRSIDAKDAYTRGHSQRVAELSRMLARRIGLPDDLCERVYLSGLLHDIGKIGVPEGVLTKPGRLTDAEFEAIKKHPAIGAEILSNIKQLQDIVPGVLYHHERWDGRGYPYALTGNDIPLMGRIICVADAFDAMSSTRTYRPALPLETVLAEIRRCAGAQFDPALANVFVLLDFSTHRRAVDEQLRAIRQFTAAEVRS